jgi:Xaa-Pro aminopeptidase
MFLIHKAGFFMKDQPFNYESRMKKVQNRLKEKSYDAYLVCNAENRHYLTGFFADDHFINEISGYLFITENDVLLATDSRYETQAKNQTQGIEIVCFNKLPENFIPDVLKKMEIQSLGYESNRISVELYNKLQQRIIDEKLVVQLVPDPDFVGDDRCAKEPFEIDAIKQSLNIAEQAFLKTLESINPKMTEKEIAWKLETEIRQGGADSLSFDIIVASGPNAALPHAVPTDRIVGKKTPILFDWGARLNGYCSDTSRTIIFGRPEKEYINAFNILVDAQKLATEHIIAGNKTKDVAQKIDDFLANHGYKETKFNHGLGHGVGLATHEMPTLSLLKDNTLEENAVVTVEPGIYIPNHWGIRLENMVVVKKENSQILNQLPVQFDMINI